MTTTRVPVVYRIWDDTGRLIYVGATVTPMQRMANHLSGSWWFALAARISYEPHEHIDSALASEWTAIAEESPAFNIRHNGGRAEQVCARLTARDVQVCRDWLVAKRWRCGGDLPMALRWIADGDRYAAGPIAA